MPVYQHSPLSQPDRSIRLLQLLPRRDDPKNVRCKLFECALHSSDQVTRPYEALSYSWGSDQKTRSIIILNDHEKDKEMGGQELGVTENFYMALLHLRDNDIPRIIWADAVCIDQLNTREKEIQIPLMAEIYAKANQVIVWLGEARDDSDEAFQAIRVAAESSINLSKKRPSVQSLSSLLKRPWFRRIWVSI
jgi:Heterokaryon incompatibility protein (HET)